MDNDNVIDLIEAAEAQWRNKPAITFRPIAEYPGEEGVLLSDGLHQCAGARVDGKWVEFADGEEYSIGWIPTRFAFVSNIADYC